MKQSSSLHLQHTHTLHATNRAEIRGSVLTQPRKQMQTLQSLYMCQRNQKEPKISDMTLSHKLTQKLQFIAG